MKNVGTIVFAILLAFVATTNAVSSTWGGVYSGDRILLSERIFNYSTPYGVARSVQFPKYGYTNNVRITGIQVTDYAYNVTASWPTLVAGGPGFTYATVNFQSKPYFGLDYHMVIYGR